VSIINKWKVQPYNLLKIVEGVDIIIKKSLLCLAILLFLLAAISLPYFAQDKIDRDDLISSLKNKDIMLNSDNIIIRATKDINNKYIILFSYNQKGSSDDFLGLAIYEKDKTSKFIFDKLYTTNNTIDNNITITTDNEGNNVSYSILFGIIKSDDDLANYRNINKGNSNKIQRGTYFINIYEIH
jgi:hypothetical protein